MLKKGILLLSFFVIGVWTYQITTYFYPIGDLVSMVKKVEKKVEKKDPPKEIVEKKVEKEDSPEEMVEKKEELQKVEEVVETKPEDRIDKISQLVTNTVEHDTSKLEVVQKEQDELKARLAQLSEKENSLQNRLVKLKRISRILTPNKEMVKQVTIAPMQPLDITRSKEMTLVRYNGTDLLIRDNKRLRVSQAVSNSFVESIKKILAADHQISEVVLNYTKGSKGQIQVLKEYLNKKFGWSPQVVETNNQSKNVEINILTKMSSLNAESM